MFTTEMASKRLHMDVELIEDICFRLNIENQIFNLKSLNETSLHKYLDRYAVNISKEGLSRIIERCKTLKEIILSLTCKSGSVLNLEPIWIIFKIVMYEIPKVKKGYTEAICA